MHVTADSPAPKNTVLVNPADRFIVWLVFLLTCVSFIATLPQTLHLLSYAGPLEVTHGELGFRWLREATLTVIVIVSTVAIITKRRPIIYGTTAVVSFLILSWVVVVAFWSITIKHVPPPMAALGVRLLQYTPLILLGYVLTRTAGHAPLALFARLLRYYILIQAPVAIYQALGGTRELWYRTIFGYRAFGTFASYNAFGPTMVACALVFCVVALWTRRIGERRRFVAWIYLAGLLAILSGSRTAILLGSFVIVYYHLAALPLDIAFKRILITVTPLLALAFYYVANDSVLTGRRATSPTLQNEARFTIWADQLAAFETTGDLIFGVGLGEGTTAAAWLKDIPALGQPARSPHSTYLSVAANFGLVGLLAYVGALALTLTRAPPVLAAAFVVTVAGLSVPLSFLEVFPANAVLLFLWGCILGSTPWWNSECRHSGRTRTR